MELGPCQHVAPRNAAGGYSPHAAAVPWAIQVEAMPTPPHRLEPVGDVGGGNIHALDAGQGC